MDIDIKKSNVSIIFIKTNEKYNIRGKFKSLLMKNVIEYSAIKLTSADDKILITGIVKRFQKDMLIICANEKIKLKINEEVLINMFNKDKGIFIYNGVISDILKNTIVVKNVKFLFNEERRNKNRIIVKIHLEVSKIRNVTEKVIELNKPIFMTSRNLSIKGILLECVLDIPKEVSFFVELPIEDKKIYIEAITKRKYKKNSLYYYGCEFIIKDTAQNCLLEKFILKNYNTKFFKYYPKQF